MRLFGQHQLFLTKSQCELFLLVALEVQVSGPTLKFQVRRPTAGVAAGKLGKLHRCIGRKPQRSSIFEFDLRPGVSAGADLGALGDGQVEEGLFEALSGIAVNLNRALYLTETDNASLRVSERGN